MYLYCKTYGYNIITGITLKDWCVFILNMHVALLQVKLRIGTKATVTTGTRATVTKVTAMVASRAMETTVATGTTTTLPVTMATGVDTTTVSMNRHGWLAGWLTV